MKSTLAITRERMEEIILDKRASLEEFMTITRMALAAMDSELVAEVVSIYGDPEAFGEREIRPLVGIQQMPYGTKLFRHAQPAPVIPSELHPDTKKLVTEFCTALAKKLYKAQLKYGYDADWKQDGWPSQCQAHFHQHIAKGDPRDVAAYCAFMWYHGWKTEAAQQVPVVPEECLFEGLDKNSKDYEVARMVGQVEGWNAYRAAMLAAAPQEVK
jgi:hypothetical protein